MGEQLEKKPEDIVAESAYFDAKWYAEKYHIAQEEAAGHYLNEGWKLGYDPSDQFSTLEYLHRRCDIVDSGINPLLHCELKGKKFWRKFKRVTEKCDLEGFGLEIGPYFNPICPKSRGYRVEILDCADRDTLYRQGLQDPNVGDKVKRIEPVDYIWSGEDYRELIGSKERYDYIIASHVIEHTTDLVGFLEQCAALLKENGILSLVIPDKRYCFDFFRENSSLSKVIDKYMAKDKSRHSKGTLAETTANSVMTNYDKLLESDEYRPMEVYTSQTPNYKIMKSILEEDEYKGKYIDEHEWVFTPASFRILVNDLQGFDLIRNLAEAAFYPTYMGCNEFFISFRKVATPKIDVPAWLARKTMLRCERLQEDIDFYRNIKI